MQKSLRQRLTYGPIMLAALLGLLYLDHWIEMQTPGWVKPRNSGLSGVGLLIMLIFLLPAATAEVGRLFVAEHVRPYRFLAGFGSGLLVIHAFLTQFPWFQHIAASTLAFIIVFVMILSAIR